jgi:predicted acyl esterase
MDNIIVERDVSIPTGDGIVLKADIFRPRDEKAAPVIMTLGPYGKGVPYSVGYAPQWEWLVKTHPDILPGSTRSFMTWETVDPETWVPWGYVCIRVDSRGAGRSPGYLDIFSPRETKDYYDAIEWAGVQSWSNGKVGLSGISYYAINQWAVAALQPPHLAAMIPWEGAADLYRDWGRHGGIMSNAFIETWYPRQVLRVQHGNPDAILDPWLNDQASGPLLLDKEQLKANRADPIADILKHPLDDEFYRQRSPDWSKVVVPFLSAANWAGFGLHPRGNFEAFTHAASKQKWLECHPGRHEEWFYLQQGINVQKRFLDHFLKDIDNGWQNEPPVLLRLRRPFNDRYFEVRREHAWPLPHTRWSRIYLSASDRVLSWDKPSTEESVSFPALGEPVTFTSSPLDEDTELTGPLAAKIFASSSTADMDLFVTFQAFSPDGREVDFQGTVDPHTPLAQGWLRASHRKLDPVRSLPYRPYHSHDNIQLLESDRVYELDIEIWPTSILLPAGFRLALQISGKDFERPIPPKTPNEAWVSRGSGPWLHTHPDDRPELVFGGTTTIHSGGDATSYLLLPIIDPH